MTFRYRRSIQIGLILCFCMAMTPSVPASAAGTSTKKKTAASSTTRKKKSTSVSSSSKKKKATTAAAKKKRRAKRRSAPAPVAFDPNRPHTLGVAAAIVVDNYTGAILWSKNETERRSVASLTKLMTALVFLDESPDLDDSTTVTMADVTGAGRSHVRGQNRVAVMDLFRCALISSDNAATRALARSTGLSDAEFVRRMNERARLMGMTNTVYTETTGLDAGNMSTATDQAILLRAATEDPLIREISSTPVYSFPCSRRTETLTNTNRLLRSRNDIVSSKTGFTRPAGYCLAMAVGKDDPRLTTVVLGAQSNAGRFAESAKLVNWALSAVGGQTASPIVPAGSR